MTADITTLADDVNTLIEGATFSLPIQAIRQYLPPFSVVPDDDVKVMTFALNQTYETGTRSDDINMITIQVAVMSKVSQSSGNRNQVDALMYLVQELTDLVRNADNLVSGNANYWGIRNTPVYDPAMLKDSTFCSVLEIDYRLYR